MKSVVINSSGGGADIGASSNGIIEKKYTLELSKKIANILENNGVDVYLLRNDDSTISYDDRIKKIKTKYPNSKDVVVLSNALNSSGEVGFEVIYALRNTNKLANILESNLENINYVKTYQYRWPTDTTKDYYYITRNTPGYETIIIKGGNISDKGDATLLKNKMDEIAKSIAESIMQYIGVDSNNYYVVKPGDTLYSLAKKNNTTVDKIKELNGIGDLIVIGQKIKIPGSKVTTHVVRAGDTLYSLAKKYHTSVEEIKKANSLKSNLLLIDQVLNIP